MADMLAVRDDLRLQNWTEVIRAKQESGLTNREFCAQHGISEKTYYYWLRKVRQVIPRQVTMLAYYAETYACPDCEKKTGYANILTLNPPPSLMKHSLASPSAVADVMTQKYVDGIPLYRQEKIWAREGVELSRATLANWIIRCAEDWLKPMYKELRLYLLKQSVIHADETPVQVLKEDGKPATSESRMWVYASSTRTEQQVRYC